MVRLQVLRIYRREYFHALRNGKSDEEAADIAMSKAKKEFADALALQTMSDIDRMERWADCLEVVTEFQIMLKGIPIDVNAIPSKVEAAKKEAELLQKDLLPPKESEDHNAVDP